MDDRFLPVTREEMLERGWDTCDFVYVLWGCLCRSSIIWRCIICRVLESHGYKVCFLSQPNWRDKTDFMRFGKPRLGFLISSGILILW